MSLCDDELDGVRDRSFGAAACPLYDNKPSLSKSEIVHQNYYWPKNVLGQQNHVKGHGICWWRRASQKLMNGTGSPVKLWLAAFKYLAADINNYTKHIQLWDGDLFWKETFGVSIA
jgi:hypothetical protein